MQAEFLVSISPALALSKQKRLSRGAYEAFAHPLRQLKSCTERAPEVIRAAYKTLSQKFHPDRHGGDLRSTKTFQLITAAYDVLSDPQRRRQHDEWIARTERRLDREAMAALAAREQRPWNGKERRARSWPSMKASMPPVATASIAGKLKIPARTLALWTAMLITTLMLLMLYQY